MQPKGYHVQQKVEEPRLEHASPWQHEEMNSLR
jgi:hypothetical protein